MIEKIKLVDLPAPSLEEREAAAVRTRDLLWAVIGDLFDKYEEEERLSFAALGRRIGRSRAQVQHWLASPRNMTPTSAGLLAEGLDADLHFELRPRSLAGRGSNYAHPSEAAAAMLMPVSIASPPALSFGSSTSAGVMAHLTPGTTLLSSAPQASSSDEGPTWIGKPVEGGRAGSANPPVDLASKWSARRNFENA